MRRLPGALIAVLLAVAACGALPADELQPSATTPAATLKRRPPARPGAGPSSSATSATPAEVPEGQQFSLDDVAEFDDGLLIEIAGTVADKATKTDRGAEATNGEIVIASVRIKNKTEEPYDAESVLIGAKYGNGKDAQIIIDETDELQSGFTGTIKPRDEAIATVGFAVPVSRAQEGDHSSVDQTPHEAGQLRHVRLGLVWLTASQATVRPTRWATAAASPRPLTPSLAKMLETCTLAVLVLMNSAEAISPLDRPSATSCSTSSSRGVSPAIGLTSAGDATTKPARCDSAAIRSVSKVEPSATACSEAVASTCLASTRSRAATRCWPSRRPAYGCRWAGAGCFAS